MQVLKTGKEEIIYLLTKAICKYSHDTGQEIIQNTNRKHYNAFAIMLSDISNQLPLTYNNLGADVYVPDTQSQQEYPHRKYDITGGQIKDALSGIVAHPRPFLVDACYIYLYGIGKKAFKNNPVDDDLFVAPIKSNTNTNNVVLNNTLLLESQHATLQQGINKQQKLTRFLLLFTVIANIAIVVLWLQLQKTKNNWQVQNKALNVLPYKPTQQEIDSLQGVWLCYTGSPQARISDALRYHKVVPNLVEIKYINGYFTYNRFGASFNHIGNVQFQSPGIISIYSRINNAIGTTASPRHSLLNLFSNSKYLSAISASWNFDVGDKNKIIGIREVYIKQGNGGHLEEVINDVENASCQCKIVRWHQTNGTINTYFLKNQLIDSLPSNDLKLLLNEKSILLNTPQEGLVIFADSLK